jgi:hypothetical protein
MYDFHLTDGVGSHRSVFYHLLKKMLTSSTTNKVRNCIRSAANRIREEPASCHGVPTTKLRRLLAITVLISITCTVQFSSANRKTRSDSYRLRRHINTRGIRTWWRSMSRRKRAGGGAVRRVRRASRGLPTRRRGPPGPHAHDPPFPRGPHARAPHVLGPHVRAPPFAPLLPAALSPRGTNGRASVTGNLDVQVTVSKQSAQETESSTSLHRVIPLERRLRLTRVLYGNWRL